MKIPVSWLREYVDVAATTAEIAERLSIATFELERISYRGVPDEDGNLGLFRVAQVLEAGKHPNADRLQLCTVDVGEPEPRQIVCGAWNFGAGATVAVALPGAVLPGGQTLGRAKLRGTVSDGMILSERELEIGPDHAGIIVLPRQWEPGTPLADVLPLGDEVIEAETGFNRPDLLSIYGIAREVAALFNGELRPMPGREPDRAAAPEPVDIRIEDTIGCPRYIGRVFRDARIGPSPEWIKARLTAAGMRPISNAVDVTNYVMLALGNPLHVFDHRTLAEGRIVVRRAAPGEELRTLDGEHRRLDPADLVIADAERAVALAGIMGGEETEVGDASADLLLEAANFEPVGIMRSSERLGLRTEGSNRWEKGVDPYLAEHAAIYATELLVDLTKAQYVGESDVQGDLPVRPVTRLRAERTDALCGIEIPVTEQHRILERLGFAVEEGGALVTVPTWRARDVTREVDAVEEVVRIHGLEHVPFTLPLRRDMFGRLSVEQRLRRVCEEVLVGAGLSEAYTPSLVADGAVRVENPMNVTMAALRTTLLDGLVESAQRNLNAGNERIALFEIARVYLASGAQLPEERLRLGGIVEGGFERAKGVLEALYDTLRVELRVERTQEPFLHPGKAARTNAGWLGELHPARLEGTWGVFELDLPTVFAAVRPVPLYEDVITYPPVRQDLAVVVAEDVPAGALVDAAREAAGPDLREARIFDVYRGAQVGKRKKSVAIALTFQSSERTMSDEDAAALRGRIVQALADSFGAELRT
ncbi:MAG TPA: phenylalanine--tRNA ligase subunit beta [Gaiellaceae bacterium]|nr:phenylalanine--tRNA ligase subunit beta [Gaiellaceae bacterium]